jgi:hypothetical protein
LNDITRIEAIQLGPWYRRCMFSLSILRDQIASHE